MGKKSKGGIKVMRIRHYIIICSQYSKGRRIARHYILPKDIEQIAVDLEKIREKCGKDVPISSHIVETASESWYSVYKKDGFFENVKLIEDINKFADLIIKDRELRGIDVAYYILSKKRIGHVKLEKLVYYCYAEFLSLTKQRLFEDSIYAFPKGPVVRTVYNEYHKKKGPLPGKYDFLSNRSRILYSEDGIKKVNVIDNVITKYGDYLPEHLVALTHRNGSPWSITDRKKPYSVISDTNIEVAHHIESI